MSNLIPSPPKLTDPRHQRALEMLLDGERMQDIAAELGVHRTTVLRWKTDEDFQLAFRAAVQAKMGAHLPELVDIGMEKARSPKAGLMAVTKMIDTLAQHSGVTAEDADDRRAGLSIEINLGDGQPFDPLNSHSDPAVENQRLRAEIAELRAKLDAPVIELDDDPSPPEAA